MKVSSGIIITDGKNILLGHSTGNTHWDIPKGEGDNGESTLETAIRETEEEFNILCNESELIDLGIYAYLKKKNLYLYKAHLKELPNVEDCECNSFFKTKKGIELPEMDEFRIFPIKEGLEKLNKSMKKVFIEHKLI